VFKAGDLVRANLKYSDPPRFAEGRGIVVNPDSEGFAGYTRVFWLKSQDYASYPKSALTLVRAGEMQE
tara:strand:+ start:4262 stop:4465 length:204 start_codon:yes stop_codon:yes gene_type:complete